MRHGLFGAAGVLLVPLLHVLLAEHLVSGRRALGLLGALSSICKHRRLAYKARRTIYARSRAHICASDGRKRDLPAFFVRVLALAVLVAALVLVSADNSEHDVEYIAAPDLTRTGLAILEEVRGGKGRGGWDGGSYQGVRGV